MTEFVADNKAKREWAADFVKVRNDLGNVAPTEKADLGTFSYKYATLGSIIDKARSVLADHGFGVAQSVAGDIGRVEVTTRIYHKDGWVESFGPVVLEAKGDARSYGSAITYARRYGLAAALGVAAEGDDDAAAAVQQHKATKPTKKAKPDHHNDAWHRAQELFAPETAVDEFKLALEAAGLEVGKDRITTAKKRDEVVGFMVAVAGEDT